LRFAVRSGPENANIAVFARFSHFTANFTHANRSPASAQKYALFH